MCTTCNQNNCGGCTQEINICNQCVSEQPCDCAVKDLSTDCSIYNQDNIECNSVVVVAKNTILSDALSNIVSWSCNKFAELSTYLRLINVGTGASIYAGDNLIGEKKLRKLKSTDNSVIITQGTDDINFTVPVYNGSETKLTNGTNTTVAGAGTTVSPYQVNSVNSTYSNVNTGTGAQVYKDSTIVDSNTQFNLRKIKSSDSSVFITEGVNDIDITVNGAETKLTSGITTSVSGAGTIVSPYVVETTNLQKVITYPADFSGTNYTITNGDNNYTIIINNSTTDVTITIPTGLTSKINVGFIQQGTGNVLFTASGTTLKSPASLLTIKGENYNGYIEKVGTTEVFHVLGNLKA